MSKDESKYHRLEGFRKFEKILRVGKIGTEELFVDDEDEIVVQEKLDGGNFSFYVKNGQVFFNSRNTSLQNEDGTFVGSSQFNSTIDFVKGVLSTLSEERLKSLEGFIIYGESMTKHTLEYDQKTPRFVGYDVFDVVADKFLDCNLAYSIIGNIGFETARIVGFGKAKDFRDKNLADYIQISSYAPKTDQFLAEGVVFKNYNKQLFCKIVRDTFAEKNKKAVGKSKQKCKTDSERFIASYCTNARIKKCINKLIDEDEKLELSMMKKLVKMVYEDLIEEEAVEYLLKGRVTLETGLLRNMVGERCKEVLKMVISEFNGIKKDPIIC